MSSLEPTDWSKVLSLAVHELRSPLTVVSGYVRMLQRGGTLTDPQQQILREVEKSCGRLSGLIAELNDLAQLEAGTAPFNRSRVSLFSVLDRAALEIPKPEGAEVVVSGDEADAAAIEGDAHRLGRAFVTLGSMGLRELIDTRTLTIDRRVRREAGSPVAWIVIGSPSVVSELADIDPQLLVPLDDTRAGLGFGLLVARRVIEAHDGGIWSPRSGQQRAASIIRFPLRTA